MHDFLVSEPDERVGEKKPRVPVKTTNHKHYAIRRARLLCSSNGDESSVSLTIAPVCDTR